tara:strand:+ start:10039 stop:11895 length:1857 start_codon:yes stop_codon:yes gene_type:complete
MAELKFLDKARVTASQIYEDSRTYISRVYSRAGDFFTTASPFAQILQVMAEMNEMLMYYIEDSTVEQNIYTAQQSESIYGLARLTGHDPTRGFAATGEIRFRWKPGATDDVAGNNLIIEPNTQIQYDNNGLMYFLRTQKDEFLLPKSSNGWIQANIIQGELESQTVTGSGEKLQSFNIKTGGMVDHNLIKVSVNGERWTKFDSLYEMRATDKGCLIKTGISGGIDIYFGTGNFGVIPPTGSTIEIEYIKCQGASGNLNQSGDLTFKWIGEGKDSTGETYDLNELLDVETVSAPFMGADSESLEFTKTIAPFASKSFVLANPDNYEYFLSRYAQFSYLDAYNTTNDGYLDDDNVIYIFAIPDLEKRLLKGTDYFSVPEEEFFFSKEEVNRFIGVIEDSGQQMVTSEVVFVEPESVKYSMEISIRWFEGYKQEDIFNDIRAAISNYLIKIVRRDKLPKSDIVALIEGVEGVDAVNVQFISSVEEEARKNGYYTYKQVTVTPTTPELQGADGDQKRLVFFKRTEEIKKVALDQKDMLIPVSGGETAIKNWYDKIGLDKYGDIILDKQEVALFRGGWEDRDGNLVKDEPSIGEMASLTVYFDNPPVPRTIYSKIQAGNRRAL